MPLERVVKALYEYEATDEDELAFDEDDLLAVTNTDNDEWLQATRLDDGSSGLIPINYVEDLECLAVMKAGFDYTANEQNELNLKEGESVYVMSRVEEEWWLVRSEAGVYGLVPVSYLEESSKAGKGSQEIHFESHWKGKFVDGKKKFEGVFGLTDDQHVAFLSQDSALFMVPLKSVISFEGGILKCNNGKFFTLELSAQNALAFSKLINPTERTKENVQKENTHVALYSYEADGEDEVNLREGERLTLLEHQDEDWSLVALSNGISGLVPRSYIADTLSKEFEHMSLQSWTEVESTDYKQSPEIISSTGGKQSTSPELVSESTSVNELNPPQKTTVITPVAPAPSSKTTEIPPPPPLPAPVLSPKIQQVPQIPSPKQQPSSPAASAIPPPPPMPVLFSPKSVATPVPPQLPSPSEVQAIPASKPSTISMKLPSVTQTTPTASPRFIEKPIVAQPSPKVPPPNTKLPTVRPQQTLSVSSDKPTVKTTPPPIYQQKVNISASSLSPKEDFTHARVGLKPISPTVVTPSAAAPAQPSPRATFTSNEDPWKVPKKEAPKAPTVGATLKPQWITKDVPSSLSPKESIQSVKHSPEIIKPSITSPKSTTQTAVSPSTTSITSPKTNRPSLSELAKKYGTTRTTAPASKAPELAKPTENPWSNLSIKKPSTQPVPVKKSLPDRPEHASSSTKPKPGNTRLWNDRSSKFQVEAEYLSFTNGQVELLKLNGKKVTVPLDMLSERDVEFVYRKEGLPIETAKPSNSSAPSPGAWLTLLLEIGIDRTRASGYSQVLAKEKLVPSQFTDLTRDFLKGRGFIEADILSFLKAAAKKKAVTLEQSATQSNLDRVRSMSKSPEGASLVPYKFPPVKSPSYSPTTSSAPDIYQPSSITTFSTKTHDSPNPATYTATQTRETTRTRLQRTSVEPVANNVPKSPPASHSYDNLPYSTTTRNNNNTSTNYMNNTDLQPYQRPQVQMTSYQPPAQNYQQHVYQPPPMPTYTAPVPTYASIQPTYPYAQPMPQVHHNIVVTKYTTSNNSSQGSANSFSQQRPHVQRPPAMPPYQQQHPPYPYPNPYQQQQPFPPQFPPQNPFMNPFQQFPPGSHFPPYGQGGYY